jgi:uncharacterized protein (TIGR03083 family)
MAPLDSARYLQALQADAARISGVALNAADAAVPGCPGWDVGDVVRHLASVYRHKAASVRLGRRAPDEPHPTEPRAPAALVTQLEASLADLLDAIGRDGAASAWTWWDGDRTVGFWQRRMAQETLVHRVDVEQAAGSAPVVDDELAVDGVDEVLTAFLPVWLPVVGAPASLTAHVAVGCGGRTWDVRVAGTSATVGPGDADQPPAAVLEGPADAVLLWAWGRGDASELSVRGDERQVRALRTALAAATQ